MMDKNIFTFSIFPKEVKHGISTRYFGSIKDSKGWHTENLDTFTKTIGISSQVVFPLQKHTGNVQYVISDDSALYDETDGLFTKQKGIGIGVVTADCLPVMLYEPEQRFIGIVHAGYKGILAGIIEEMIANIQRAGGNLEIILIGIGPAIGACCYDIPKERALLFKKAFPKYNNFLIKKNNNYYLDLVSLAKQILEKKGVKLSHIEAADICTKDNMDKFFSFRGDTKETFGEFASIISL